MIARLVILVLLASCAPSTPSPRLPGVSVQHIPGGWTRVIGPGDAYSFELPGEPRSSATSSTTLGHLYVFPDDRPEWERFVVEVGPAEDPIQALDAATQRITERFSAQIVSTETSSSAPERKLSLVLRRTKLAGLARIQVVKRRVFSMIATHPAGSSFYQQEAERFFRSLQVQGGGMTMRLHHDYLELGNGRAFALGRCGRAGRGTPQQKDLDRVFGALMRDGRGEVLLIVEPGLDTQAIRSRLAQLGFEVRTEEQPLPARPCATYAGGGTLKKDLVGDVIRASLGRFKHCFKSQLVQHPDAGGVITSQFVIGTSGEVRSAEIVASTMGVAAVEDCVLRTMRELVFPKPDGGEVIVTYPFTFVAR